MSQENIRKGANGEQFIFDGEIHIIDDDFGYALTEIGWPGEEKISRANEVRIGHIKQTYCEKFAMYIMAVDPKMAVKMIASVIADKKPQNMDFIVKPSGSNPLINQMTVGLKFDRLPGDSVYFDKKKEEKKEEVKVEKPRSKKGLLKKNSVSGLNS